MRLAAEEIRNTNLDFQSKCETILDREAEAKAAAIGRRDEAWIREIARRYPDLEVEMRGILESLNQDQDTNNEVPRFKPSSRKIKDAPG